MKEDDVIRQLEKLDKEIEAAKNDLGRSEGRLSALMQSLERDFSLKTLDEAEKELASLKNQIEKMRSEFDSSFAKLKESYQW